MAGAALLLSILSFSISLVAMGVVLRLKARVNQSFSRVSNDVKILDKRTHQLNRTQNLKEGF